MLTYDLTAEYISLIITAIIIISMIWNKELSSFRQKLFGLMYYGTLASIIATIVSTLTSRYFNITPLWIVEALKVIYFILAPVTSFFGFLFTLSLTQVSSTRNQKLKSFIWGCIPFAIYVLLILTNYFHHWVFHISDTVGYVRGPLFQSTYFAAGSYIFLILLITIKSRKTPQHKITLVICLNMLLPTFISLFQFFNSSILLSGFTSLSCVLIVYLYVQNTKATTDKLTTLLNRQSLTYYITKFSQHKYPFSLYIISLQNFKGVNERFGLEIGDIALQNVSQLLLNNFPKDYIFRYSGDEFAILTRNKSNYFEDRIKSVMRTFKDSFILRNHSVKLDIVCARVDYPEFSEDVKTLITTADYSISQLQDKSFENNYLYDLDICTEMKRHTLIIDVLKEAIENNGFDVFYQPIYSAKSNTFSQAEALVRLSGEYKNEIFPGEFIPIAEKTGLIVKMTYYIVEKVCKDLRYLIDIYGESLKLKSISINFPYKIFFQSDILVRLMEILDKYSISPSQIKIEITERSLISTDKTVATIIDTLKDVGFIFELDDFGVEYSNMSVFLSLPISYIKIDRSLLIVSIKTPTRKIFFENLIKGIHAIGAQVIVEGAEDEEQLEFILNCGCEYVQGYVFSRPLPFDGFIDFLTKN